MQTAAPPGLRHRLAALGALACLAGAVAVTILLLWGEVARLAVSAALVALVVVGVWYVVSRRRLARLAGLLIAAGGLIALLAVIFTGEHHGLGLLAPVALVLASGACARFALRRGRRSQGAAAPAPLAGHPVLLINPKSGGGKAERFDLVEECRRRGIEPVVLQRGDDLVQLAEDAIVRGADVIGMAGGDGSQALVATVASSHGVPYVCVPTGTRNHFALDLGLDRQDVVGALDAFQQAVERRIDLARVNGRVFVNNASMGLYAKIVQSPAYRADKLKTAAELLPDLLGPGTEPFDLGFVGPDGSTHPTAHLILVSNDPYQLDHLAGRGTRARMDLGVLGVTATQIAGAQEAVEFVGLEAAGKIRKFRHWLEWETPKFRVDSARPVEIGIDGEALRMDPPLIFDSLPAALRVRLPQHAPGSAPAAAAVHLTSSTVSELIGVAVGRSS